ncbi:hypothetical protein conserved [Leishmania donovani]|nr:hypothetical protein CGC21_33010 [Leishmania donovani]TPP50162.1 hypothetical protein CGC20_17545 [Leishmania donovani]CAJ1987108.1 hypothetical protein conserved [Leishmania donovani]
MSSASSSKAPSASAVASTADPADAGSVSSSPTLTAAEMKEFAELRCQNQLLKAENAVLQRKLEEERAQRRQSQLDENHYNLEAEACREAIEKTDGNAQVLALYDELQRLRKKCDIYAEAVEESRSYFFEMKRLYMEVSPYLRSLSGDSQAHRAASV